MALIDYLEIESRVIKKFEKALQNKTYKIYREYPLSTSQRIFRADAFIKTISGRPLALIEIKRDLNNKNSFINGRHQCLDIILQFQIPFAILTDESNFFLISNEQLAPQKIEFQDIINRLDEYVSPSGKKNSSILTNLKEILPKGKYTEKDIIGKEDGITLSERLETDIKNIILTNEDIPQRVYRYVSLETAFNIIMNKTIRMNGIVGMNDSSEINFVGEHFYGKNYLDTIPDEKEKINDIFILSCSTNDKGDDLTQWRLYADDAKGVCLGFDVKKPQYRYDVRKVVYIDSEQKDNVTKKISKKNKENEIFWKIKDLVARNNIFFKNFHTWSHFIKPSDYKVESEVRVLYENKKIKKQNWFLSKPLNILSSYIDVELNDDFPLTLKLIRLGPKCPERNINQIQLRVMLDRSGFKNVDVIPSDIDNYR